ncbi:MAG: hypothetical protein AAGB00_05510 [Planctomycetota bacterium]
MLFTADLDTGSQDALFLHTGGELLLIAREGTPFDVVNGEGETEQRIIDLISFESASGGSDGRGTGLSDNGEVAFLLRFTDGSEGVFVAQSSVIPEPSGLLMLGFFALASITARRRVF